MIFNLCIRKLLYFHSLFFKMLKLTKNSLPLNFTYFSNKHALIAAQKIWIIKTCWRSISSGIKIFLQVIIINVFATELLSHWLDSRTNSCTFKRLCFVLLYMKTGVEFKICDGGFGLHSAGPVVSRIKPTRILLVGYCTLRKHAFTIHSWKSFIHAYILIGFH